MTQTTAFIFSVDNELLGSFSSPLEPAKTASTLLEVVSLVSVPISSLSVPNNLEGHLYRPIVHDFNQTNQIWDFHEINSSIVCGPSPHIYGLDYLPNKLTFDI